MNHYMSEWGKDALKLCEFYIRVILTRVLGQGSGVNKKSLHISVSQAGACLSGVTVCLLIYFWLKLRNVLPPSRKRVAEVAGDMKMLTLGDR